MNETVLPPPSKPGSQSQGELPWPPWGWGAGPAGGVGSWWVEFPGTGDIEDDVMRVQIKDSWRPPALLLENFRDWGWISWITGTKAESQVQSSFCL